MNEADRHQQSIEYALEVLQREEYLPYIEAIYLFGSYARKTHTQESDVDILVQCNEQFTPRIGRQMRVAAMPSELAFPEVELKFVVGDDWTQKDDQFSRNLTKDGVLLWKKEN